LQSAFAHGAGFGVITFMLKLNSRDQLTVQWSVQWTYKGVYWSDERPAIRFK